MNSEYQTPHPDPPQGRAPRVEAQIKMTLLTLKHYASLNECFFSNSEAPDPDEMSHQRDILLVYTLFALTKTIFWLFLSTIALDMNNS